MDRETFELRSKQVLYDEKWKKFLRRVWLFRHIPFIEFALAAGSMATGNVHPDSDFDVIVSVRGGRIFTARLFAVAAFGTLGWRRKKFGHKEAAADKICFNHFVTESSYRLTPPYNKYWQFLYQKLVPIFGSASKINSFWRANGDWLGMVPECRDDLRYRRKNSSVIQRAVEFILGGRLGDVLENIFKAAQIKRIESSLKSDSPGYKPRLIYSDFELEFHPDTRRIENFTPTPNKP